MAGAGGNEDKQPLGAAAQTSGLKHSGPKLEASLQKQGSESKPYYQHCRGFCRFKKKKSDARLEMKRKMESKELRLSLPSSDRHRADTEENPRAEQAAELSDGALKERRSCSCWGQLPRLRPTDREASL